MKSTLSEYEKLPIVSIIIPCRNEEKYIGKCLDSIINQDFPKEKMEILVVDGMSTDKTKEIIRNYEARFPFIVYLENKKKIVPNALNKGIEYSKGDLVLILGSHGNYSSNHVIKCVEYMEKYKADNVGGLEVIVPGSDSLIGEAIALALSHPFGVGNARYRIGTKKPIWADTVACSCYRKDVFDKIGFFDEELVRNQDDEFNLRLIKNGGKILLVPDIISHYYARDSLAKLWKMYFQYGHFKPLVVKKIGSVLTWRQLIPTIFIISIILTGFMSLLDNIFLFSFLSIVSLYLIINFIFSFIISLKKKKLRLVPFLIASFASLHLSYGFGYLKGIWDFIILKKNDKKKIEDLPINR